MASLGGFVRDVLEKTGYIDALASLSTIEAEGKLENINELITAMEEFIPSSSAAMPLQEFLDQVALISDMDKMEDGGGAVTMMTLHLAKGLEFSSVYMVGMEEGLFPHARSQEDPEELEEERRLCYVGMTRAMKELTLTHAFRRRQFGNERYNVASRFLDEISPQYVVRLKMGCGSYHVAHTDDKIGVKADRQSLKGESWRASKNFPKDTSPRDYKSPVFTAGANSVDYEFDQRPPEEKSAPFSNGMRVVHPSFGRGIVSCCERTSSGHKVTVRFSNGSVKKLIAEFAGLIRA
jgi:DNA helicase-2/ATP-dependent DNA helicase PcrA